MASVTVTCRYCNSNLVYKHAHARSGEARYWCPCCQLSFQSHRLSITLRADQTPLDTTTKPIAQIRCPSPSTLASRGLHP